MIAIYILILCLSTGFASWVGIALWGKFAPLFGKEAQPIGALVLIPAIAFLIVVGAPPSLLFCASVLLGLFTFLPSLLTHPYRGLLAIAAGIVITLNFSHVSLVDYLGHLPLFTVLFGSAVLWLGFMAVPAYATTPTSHGLIMVAACLPLACTSLWLHHESGVVTDVAIFASTWFGATLAARSWHVLSKAHVLVGRFLLGYWMLTACWQGAWELAVLSALLLFTGSYYARHYIIAQNLEFLNRA